ncbi:MAG: hypothetical protein UY92_C0002G0064 [Candidatus Magasanikbacteria bacterium GW2011_GWA2_56_11]|uniref:26 kDa periplasmic immunogenic protein n=1 Tax=Candidatus Magasanikbacteria bacterium GW2011_GWA2_56_11 TaxID=1619044 RepID=A0A0G2ANM2_9BACT|nr:MAG: hypothetical protein UY92_C0002G0064 [Candidatus Magasanikbacteria bacterium GW2011_GWA2_56_11]
MPVKKNGAAEMPESAEAKSMPPVRRGVAGNGCCAGASDGTRKLMLTLLGILLVYLIVFFGTLIRNNLKRYDTIGRVDKSERTIVVEGEGKVAVKPDIAVTTMGMIAEAKTVAEAQEKNTAVMNKLLERLKQLGVEEKDIQTTNYNIFPQYDYTDDGQVLRGYQVSQSVAVKIRDTSKANQVIALAGEVGVNDVSGLEFTVDDREQYRSEARRLALEQVAAKARALSEALGIQIRGIVSYNEYDEVGKGMMYDTFVESVPAEKVMPGIEPGSTEVVMDVSVVFEIR